MNGLTDKEVIENRKKYGTNKITIGKKETFLSLFIESLGDPIIKILLIALAVKTIFLFRDFDWYETIGIVISILVASLISTISEYGSSKAFEKMMKDASKTKCRVRRNNKKVSIYLEELVVGDILYLSSGDKIGADCTIIKGEIEADESMLSGEVTNVRKNIKDVVYRGCVVFNGSAIAVVEKTGNQTYYGKMIEELNNSSGTSPLKERLNSLAIGISKLGYFAAILVAISYLFNKILIQNNFNITRIIATISNFPLLFSYLIHALTISVTVIIVSVPEGLPLLINLVLSSNMRRMLKNNVLVRKLVGIETAGSLNILFTDKTGTLTKGKLEVVEFMLGNTNTYKYYDNLGSRFQKKFIEGIIYNNESTYDKDNNQIIGGNITDRAILNYVKILKNDNIEVLKQTYFDSKNKYSSITIKDNERKIRYVKGASEVILKRCKFYLNEDGFKAGIIDYKKIEEKLLSVTKKGIRVLCLAYSLDTSKGDLDSLILIGFLFIKDEVREEAVKSVSEINKAGIQVVLVTGDNKDTAVNIAKEVGIVTSDKDIILHSDDLCKMTNEEVAKILPRLKVVARALPTDKSRLVEIAKSNNLVVGMTGDGVNDAVALKKADVGFAMGSGTEVAKESADIVIIDDNILSIKKAVLYGRTIFKSIRKFIIFQLTVNLCAVSVSVIGPFIGVSTPVTVIQMLWINMVMDTLAGLAFSYEPPLDEYMLERPKKREEAIINSYMLNEILITGIYSSILCLVFLKSKYIKSIFRPSIDNRYLLTAFFGLFIFISIFNSLNARTTRLNILSNIFKNKVFIIIMLFISLVQVVMIYYGGSLFRTTGLTVFEFLVMLLFASSIIIVDLLRKFFYKRANYSIQI